MGDMFLMLCEGKHRGAHKAVMAAGRSHSRQRWSALMQLVYLGASRHIIKRLMDEYSPEDWINVEDEMKEVEGFMTNEKNGGAAPCGRGRFAHASTGGLAAPSAASAKAASASGEDCIEVSVVHSISPEHAVQYVRKLLKLMAEGRLHEGEVPPYDRKAHE